MLTVLLRVAGLTGIYLLVLTSVHPGDLLTGLAVAVPIVVAMQFAHRSRASGGPTLRRLAAVPRLVWGTLADVVRGAWEVSGFCLRRSRLRPGMVAVPIGRCSPGAAAAWGIRVGIAPDSVVVELDERKGQMILHVLDASDPDAVRAAQLASYERLQRRVFP